MTRPVALPVRIQLSRKKGFRLQEVSKALNGLPAVNVARPSRWGNPFRVDQIARLQKEYPRSPETSPAELACSLFRGWLNSEFTDWFGSPSDADRKAILNTIEYLRGKNLACWCGPDDPCHADVLIELANKSP